MTRRLRRGRVLGVVALVAVLGLAIGGLAWSRSSAFDADTLRVEGASFRSDADVLDRAGIDATTNVLHFDRAAAVAALREDPWIADAWIETEFPSTIVVHVRERSPVAAAEGHGIAADGVWLPDADLRGLPVLRPSTGALDPAVAIGAVASLVDLPARWRRDVEIALVLPDGTVRFTTGTGPSIVWGRPGLGEAKATALRAVARWADGGGVGLDLIDVSVPATPAARTSDGSTVSL